MSQSDPTNGTTMPIPAPSDSAVAANNPTREALDRANTPRPFSGYTCGGCDTRWNGVSRCHCSGCHETFAGLALFDSHRRDIKGAGTCIDPDTITRTPKETKLPERAMFLTGGIWQSVEDPTPRGQHLRKSS